MSRFWDDGDTGPATNPADVAEVLQNRRLGDLPEAEQRAQIQRLYEADMLGYVEEDLFSEAGWLPDEPSRVRRQAQGDGSA